uniref:Uncharacterized protein n=1 Tax=Pseudomonas aeruginosa TaxID=287 RepID=A0A2L1KHL0_PSEAI|nr:Hypothetical protein [Pseudomonas aeruginosa]AVE21816.1 Hypothetical protein [Pseudomonas aeruginosa]
MIAGEITANHQSLKAASSGLVSVYCQALPMEQHVNRVKARTVIDHAMAHRAQPNPIFIAVTIHIHRQIVISGRVWARSADMRSIARQLVFAPGPVVDKGLNPTKWG